MNFVQTGYCYHFNDDELADQRLGEERAREFLRLYEVTVDTFGVATVKRRTDAELTAPRSGGWEGAAR